MLYQYLVCGIGRGISGSFFLSLSFSRSQVIINKSTNDNFFGSKKRGFSENIIISAKNVSFWTNKVSFDDFLMTTSERESKRRKKPQIPSLWLLWYSNIKYEECWLFESYLLYLKTTLNVLIFNFSPLVTSSLCHFTCQMDHHPIVSLNYESAKSLTWYCSNCLWIVCKDRRR